MPTRSVGPSPHGDPQQGDTWVDTTAGHMNLFNGERFVPVTAPALSSALTASQAGINGGPMYIPCITASLGGSWYVPTGYVGMAYDITNNRLAIVGSGGHTFKTVAFA